jgi:arylamine N-acetyltransferase
MPTSAGGGGGGGGGGVGIQSTLYAFNLAAYFERINLHPALASPPPPTVETLKQVMLAHSRTIPFENIDVVLGKAISMAPKDVEAKMVSAKRGGYCFEQNTLLLNALLALGFDAIPLLCRVRWGKPEDQHGTKPNTAFTHMAVKVRDVQEGGSSSGWLADVGFAGTNSIAPVQFGTEAAQQLPEGDFRLRTNSAGLTSLALRVKGEWRELYTFQEQEAPWVDLELSNWFSCTFPTARFTSQFFTSLVVGETNERHHILNGSYVIRRTAGGPAETTVIESKEQLVTLLSSVFGITLPTDGLEGLDRYLSV